MLLRYFGMKKKKDNIQKNIKSRLDKINCSKLRKIHVNLTLYGIELCQFLRIVLLTFVFFFLVCPFSFSSDCLVKNFNNIVCPCNYVYHIFVSSSLFIYGKQLKCTANMKIRVLIR